MKSIKNSILDWLDAVVVALAFVVILFTFVLRIATIDGISMYPTLEHGERVLAFQMFYTPVKGDIVIVSLPSENYVPYIKRVVATEGDTIEIDHSTGEVIVNGEVLEEDYILPEENRNYGSFEGQAVVPDGCVYVLGDNRNNSKDSRYGTIGFVEEEYIIGHAFLRVYPFDSIEVL